MPPQSAEALDKALATLREGGLILYPTDTIWGIGCDATRPDAVRRVFELKRRSEAKSLVLLAASLDMVGRFVKDIPQMAVQLIEVNDHPMTIIYPKGLSTKAPREGEAPEIDRRLLAYNVVAEDGSVGIRIPLNEWCRQLSYKLGRPVVSTSANISGEPSPRKFSDISDQIKAGVDYIVPPKLERDSLGVASQIIRVEMDGVVKVIR